LEKLIKKIIEFRDSRGWDEHDTPESLAKSILIESAELLENFQWGKTSYDSKNVQDEIADILILVLALVHDLNLDLEEIILQKLVKIEEKYPLEK